MGDTGASGGMSPRRPQTRVRSGAYLGGRTEKSNRWTESSTVLDSSDADSIRVLCPNPGIQSHPPGWTVLDGLDSRLQIVCGLLGQSDQGQRCRALGLVVGSDPDLAAGPDSRLHASPKLGIPRCVTYVRRRTD